MGSGTAWIINDIASGRTGKWKNNTGLITAGFRRYRT
jgi:hypothetical protein